MEYRRFDNTIIVRIDKGEEILEKIKEVSLKENIKLASVSALGATKIDGRVDRYFDEVTGLNLFKFEN